MTVCRCFSYCECVVKRSRHNFWARLNAAVQLLADHLSHKLKQGHQYGPTRPSQPGLQCCITQPLYNVAPQAAEHLASLHSAIRSWSSIMHEVESRSHQKYCLQVFKGLLPAGPKSFCPAMTTRRLLMMPPWMPQLERCLRLGPTLPRWRRQLRTSAMPYAS